MLFLQSYPMRNAMTEVIGLLIKELTSTDDAISVPSSAGSGSSAGGDGEGADAARGSVEARKRQVEGFFDLLFERFLDINSYVRSKLISVCGRLCE